MRRALLICLLLTGIFATAQTPSLRVTQVDPSVAASLGAQDFVSAKVEYSSPVDALIFVRPYFGGQEVRKGKSHPSPIYQSGTGEAFGWFQIDSPEAVDSIHVRMLQYGSRNVLVEIDYPVTLTFSGKPGSTRERAEWAIQASAAQQQLIRTQGVRKSSASSSRSTPGSSFFGYGLLLILIAAFIAAFAWPAYGAFKWKGMWRYAAALPLAILVLVVLRILIDTSRDPTSHNLWPFEIAMFGGGSLAFMFILSVLRNILRVETHS